MACCLHAFVTRVGLTGGVSRSEGLPCMFICHALPGTRMKHCNFVTVSFCTVYLCNVFICITYCDSILHALQYYLMQCITATRVHVSPPAHIYLSSQYLSQGTSVSSTEIVTLNNKLKVHIKRTFKSHVICITRSPSE